MGPWGLHYERTQTWWERTSAWHEYLARCQFLLRQGLFVADLCLLSRRRPPNPERTTQFPVPAQLPTRTTLSSAPATTSTPAHPRSPCTRMSVRDGPLFLPDGMSYRVLVLPQVETMTPRLLRKIKELVLAGATVLGSPPAASPSLSGYPECDREVKALAADLWGRRPRNGSILHALRGERAHRLG